jgi:hypothetical protein
MVAAAVAEVLAVMVVVVEVVVHHFSEPQVSDLSVLYISATTLA